jgi:hypothetical protein
MVLTFNPEISTGNSKLHRQYKIKLITVRKFFIKSDAIILKITGK